MDWFNAITDMEADVDRGWEGFVVGSNFRQPTFIDSRELFHDRFRPTATYPLRCIGYEIKYFLTPSDYEEIDDYKCAVAIEFFTRGLRLPVNITDVKMKLVMNGFKSYVLRDMSSNRFPYYPGLHCGNGVGTFHSCLFVLNTFF